MTDLREKVEALFKKNRRVKNGYRYTVPSPDAYPYQWLWDSCFHAVILSHFDLSAAKEELLSLMSRQFPNGMIPHMIYWEDLEGDKTRSRLQIDWGRRGTSSITQPPMIAYAVWAIFQKEHDVKFLKSVYRSLFHFYKYLLNERDPHERHLAGIINPDESGEDNSPRFDAMLDLPPIHDEELNYKKRLALVAENKRCRFDAPFCMKNFFWVKDVPFNAVLVENLRCLARIAEKIGRGYDAAYFNDEAAEVSRAMSRLMRAEGLFWPTYGEDYRHIKVKTWAIFAPLFAKIPEPDEARLVLDEHLLNRKEFRAAYPVPSVSLDEPSFNPRGFWRGPTWLAVNWFVVKGLLNYGFNDAAAEIKKQSLALLAKSGFREYFNPLTGEGLGARDFTWGGLALDM